ncbi:hypothetical protein PAXINDRAFT_18490 [Paxillus involutus ATCC 200175]|uniref:Uncharacterized protein n=1 Tax=Paxillus involutus ATCC 200175 TaxID=664439 RepID=A0A0C9TLY8_PAXIN|nr:hypothetical protein PAXINDRAFT_18490 [Paxillus involutus ATCC 200175]
MKIESLRGSTLLGDLGGVTLGGPAAEESQPSTVDLSYSGPPPLPYAQSNKPQRSAQRASPLFPPDENMFSDEGDRTLIDTPVPSPPLHFMKQTSPVRTLKRGRAMMDNVNSPSCKRQAREVVVSEAFLEELVNAKWDAEEARCRAQRELQILQMKVQMGTLH